MNNNPRVQHISTVLDTGIATQYIEIPTQPLEVQQVA